MLFTSPCSLTQKFYLTLLSNVDRDKLLEIEKMDNVAIFNPNLIISAYHIMLATNRAVYNFEIKKNKSKSFKKEVIYYSSEKTRVDQAGKQHEIQDELRDYYFLFLDMNNDEIDKIKADLGGNEILPQNYNEFTLTDQVKSIFDIKEDEMMTESGILGAVYNRLCLKDLK